MSKLEQETLSFDDNPYSSECGIWNFRPRWLQCFVSQKFFLFNYAIIGVIQGMTFSYANVVLSTIEEQFGFKDYEIAWIYSGNEIIQVLCVLLLPFTVRVRKRPLFISMALMATILGLLIMALPHFISHDAFTTSHLDNQRIERGILCSNTSHIQTKSCLEESNIRNKDYQTGALIFIGSCIVGLGGCIYSILGLPYCDDNSKKSRSPLTIGIVYASRILGPGLGFALGAACLKVYIDPWNLSPLEMGDKEFVGAWWLGFPIIAGLMLLCAPSLSLFPEKLGKTNTDAELVYSEKLLQENKVTVSAISHETILTFKRLLGNKLYVFNLLASLFFLFVQAGFSAFFPKYLEVQYLRSKAEAGMFGGLSLAVAAVLGCIVSGYIIGRFKINARRLSAWCIIAGIFAVLSFVGFSLLECPQQELLKSAKDVCNCDDNLVSPICSLDGRQTFYSPCHAGCRMNNGTQYFYDCTHIEHSSYVAITGYCDSEKCKQMYIGMLGLLFAASFAMASQQIISALFMLRCIHPKDKTAHISLLIFVMNIFALLPAPMIFGYLLDTTCLSWVTDCEETFNCITYDSGKLRMLLNGFSGALIALSTLCYVGIYVCSEDLDLYSTPDENINNKNFKVENHIDM